MDVAGARRRPVLPPRRLTHPAGRRARPPRTPGGGVPEHDRLRWRTERRPPRRIPPQEALLCAPSESIMVSGAVSRPRAACEGSDPARSPPGRARSGRAGHPHRPDRRRGQAELGEHRLGVLTEQRWGARAPGAGPRRRGTGSPRPAPAPPGAPPPARARPRPPAGRPGPRARPAPPRRARRRHAAARPSSAAGRVASTAPSRRSSRSRCCRRSAFVASRGSGVSPSAASSAAYWASLPAPTTSGRSAQGTGPYGARFGWTLPAGAGTSPPIRLLAAWLTSAATATSSSGTSIRVGRRATTPARAATAA